MNRCNHLFLILVLATCTGPIAIGQDSGEIAENRDRPENFVDVGEQIPSITLDIRYATAYNFVGKPIDGYFRPRCLLTHEAALALQEVQAELQSRQFSLRVYDCYRPQRAVDHFVRWAEDLDDIAMKSVFYPNVAKKDLFARGYIAARSGHSRGSTLDLTIADLDMGTPYDLFDPLSHTDNPAVGAGVMANRQLLREVMAIHGFRNLPEEWWHYTLENEPYPDRYFDFPVE